LRVLADADREVLRVAARGTVVWRSARAVAQESAWHLGTTAEASAARMLELVEAGLLVTWHLPNGPAVALTPLAAELLGLVVTESGPDELPRWVRAEDAADQPVHTPRRCHGLPGPFGEGLWLELGVDPARVHTDMPIVPLPRRGRRRGA
jgi:hypothetical protein